jgi:transposase-like protein
MAALLAGQSVGAVAADYKLDKSTVSNWKRRLSQGELSQVNTKKQNDFSELIFGYLREALTTLTVQAEHFRDKDWLKKQGADTAAVNHGVIADKVFRILEAVERGREEPAE